MTYQHRFERHFAFMTRSMSAYDAMMLLKDDPETAYQLAKAFSDDPQHELTFALDDVEPGEPTSPVIRGVELSTSGLYVEFKFADTPVYMTIPAMSTVTLGWLRPEYPTVQDWAAAHRCKEGHDK